jgi:putative transposase
MIGICRATSRNVKRWQNGDMCLRWTAAGMLEAERQFRKIIGYTHLAALALAVEADVAAARASTTRSMTSPIVPSTTTEPAATLAAAH